MKKIGICFVIILISFFQTSCEIVQEIRFKEDGSGDYSLGIHFTEGMAFTSKKVFLRKKKTVLKS